MSNEGTFFANNFVGARLKLKLSKLSLWNGEMPFVQNKLRLGFVRAATR